MTETKTYMMIAKTLDAKNRCEETDNPWAEKWKRLLDSIENNVLPSGSGIDSGTTIDDSSTPERLVFNTAFHHMNDAGMYDGWTEHKVIVTPSLCFGYDVRITGKNRNDIKDYLTEVFSHILSSGLKYDSEFKCQLVE